MSTIKFLVNYCALCGQMKVYFVKLFCGLSIPLPYSLGWMKLVVWHQDVFGALELVGLLACLLARRVVVWKRKWDGKER